MQKKLLSIMCLSLVLSSFFAVSAFAATKFDGKYLRLSGVVSCPPKAYYNKDGYRGELWLQERTIIKGDTLCYYWGEVSND